ncbi:MAG: HPr family phosphocarrier protein [Elusimicrobiota bacterium]|nr:HPr family phosphocarrier protein [Elusimicrobiota bacterium]
MIKEDIEIKNKLGIHARPAALLAQEAGRYKSDILIARDGMEINAKSIMGIMMLAAEQGSKISLRVHGSDEEQAFLALKAVLKKISEEELGY